MANSKKTISFKLSKEAKERLMKLKEAASESIDDVEYKLFSIKNIPKSLRNLRLVAPCKVAGAFGGVHAGSAVIKNIVKYNFKKEEA